MRGQEQRNSACPEFPRSYNRASQTHLHLVVLAEKRLAEKYPIAVSTAYSPAQREKIILLCLSTSSNTGEHVLMFRCLPEQGFFFPVFTWHGISQRKQVALLGLCQLSYTIQTRFTDAVELHEWSNQSWGWGGGGSTFCINQSFFLKKWVDYPGQRNPERRRQYIYLVLPLPIPYRATGDHCSVTVATVMKLAARRIITQPSRDPCEMLWERLTGDLHLRSHFFFNLALPCEPRGRENCLCELSKEKPMRRQGMMSSEGALI